MSTTTRLGLLALAAALLLGLLGDRLFFDVDGIGLNVLLWIGGLAGTTWVVGQRGGAPLTGEGRWLMAAAALFASGLVWRSSPVLQALDILAFGICLGLAALTVRGGSLSQTGVVSYILGLALSAGHHLIGLFGLLASDVNWQEAPRGAWTTRAAAVGRGLLIALPLLLLFGGLFIAADASFEALVTDLFAIELDRFFGHIIATFFFTLLAAGFLRTALLRQPDQLPELSRPASFALGGVETGVILGLLNLLFLTFVLLQLPYLFGGAAQVAQSSALTYAEYARRGFFELVQVSALVLPVLLVLHWLVPPEQQAEQRLFRWLGSSLVALLFLIMASAVQRMYLYQREFGLTELRLYSTLFMGWMALLFVGFLMTVLRGRRNRFAPVALVSGLAVLLVMHLINPDALIVRTNLAKRETVRFDAVYAASLSPDATPVLVEAWPRLDTGEQAIIRTKLDERRLPADDWRTWNWSRFRALSAWRQLPEK